MSEHQPEHIEEHATPWVELQEKINSRNPKTTLEFLQELPHSERGRAVSHLSDDEIKALFSLLTDEDAAELLDDLSDEHAADLIELLPNKKAMDIVSELPSAEAADILADVQKDKAEAIIDAMSAEDARKTREILQHDEESAGGIMQGEFLTYRETATVGEVLDDLQSNSETYSDYDTQYVYLTSARRQLRGVLRLRDLIFSARNRPVSELKVSDPLSVKVDMPLEKLVQVFEEHQFIGLPVIDKRDRLVGIVRRNDVWEAAGERNTETFMKSSGIVGGEELRTMPIFQRSRRRLAWLSVNILLNVLAASVIAFFQDTLSSVIALAVFLPIISDMSGCSGNQAVAVSIRELSLGLVKPQEMLRVLGKEFSVGIINGIVLGALIALVAVLWKGNPYFGVVVGGALAINTVVAVCLGGLIPLLLQRMGKDPALASGPILTTVTDMCGFLLALGFATMLLPYLGTMS